MRCKKFCWLFLLLKARSNLQRVLTPLVQFEHRVRPPCLDHVLFHVLILSSVHALAALSESLHRLGLPPLEGQIGRRLRGGSLEGYNWAAASRSLSSFPSLSLNCAAPDSVR